MKCLASLAFALLLSPATFSAPPIPMDDRGELPREYTGEPSLVELMLSRTARPVGLAAGDFDEDGMPDLIVGYSASADGGLFVSWRGNVDALYRNPAGTNASPPDSPFLSPGTLSVGPARPELMAAGDFDGDGHLDLVVTHLGSESINWIHGDGRGNFTKIVRVALPGTVTAMTAGEMNRRDGLVDVVVGVTGPSGHGLLVYESPSGAMLAKPETVVLSAPATSLVLGQWDEGPERDLAALSGDEVLIVHGRDRRLSLDSIARSSVQVASISRQPAMESTVRFGPALEHGVLARLPMRLNRDAFDDFVRLDVGRAGPSLVLSGGPVTYTVNSIDDLDDGACDTVHCSLREAIESANARVGPDAIEFAIAGSGPHSIQPTSPLPEITDPVVIDGTTEPDFAGTPVVEIDGSATGGFVDGLRITAGSSVVRGLVINGFDGNGIQLEGEGGNLIEGCYLGSDVTGTLARGNGGHGVEVRCDGNTIGGTVPAARNVASANRRGVTIIESSGNIVAGNHVGTDVTGTAALGNDDMGIWLLRAPDNTVGGVDPGARNVSSGNGWFGVYITGDQTTGNLVQGNHVGTDPSGTASVSNGSPGIGGGVGFFSSANNNTLGGTTAAARNIISGNGSNGITVTDDGSLDNLLQGNFIGVDSGGATSLPNASAGIWLNIGPNGVGGAVPGAGNVISSNRRFGVLVIAGNCTVQGNMIGTDVTGTVPLGNAGEGVLLDFAPRVVDTRVGGIVADARNTIAHNGGAGVAVRSGLGHEIRENAIFANEGLAIDLGLNGVSSNDPADVDTGPNDLQNFPVLSSASSSPAGTEIAGVLESRADTELDIDLFSTSTCDLSGHGEAETFLGTLSITTDPGGAATLMTAIPVIVPAGEFVTATATDPNGNTSELSPCQEVVVGVVAPTVYESIDPADVVAPANAVGTASSSPYDHVPAPDRLLYYKVDDGAGSPPIIWIVKGGPGIQILF
ncbi:MAG: FG-GAP-like repeat-containing protein [Acidobacteriota bacterium]